MSNNILRKAVAAAAFAAVLPLQAQAGSLIVDTGTPTGGATMANTVSSVGWIAEKFSVGSTLTTIDSVSAYVLSDASDFGKTFTIALYADNGSNLPALDFGSNNQGQLYQATATYTGSAWSGVSGLNWTLNANTSYWLALEGGSADYLVAPVGAPLAAQAVAIYTDGMSPQYTPTGTSDTFGLQVSAVPEPSSLALALASLGVIGWSVRRSR